MAVIDLTNKRFGSVVVIGRVGSSTKWECKCDCGNCFITEGANLRRGRTQSCGCMKSEIAKRTAKEKFTTHRLSRTRIYRTWANMKQRCNNEHNSIYAYYGGRGIKVCKEWENNFLAFYDWAIKNGYDDTLTIDRIDNDKGYCPENCRWVTMATQSRNKRKYRKHNTP